LVFWREYLLANLSIIISKFLICILPYNSQSDDPNFKLDFLLVTHYNNVSEQIGYLIKPGESQVNNLGYHILNQKQFIKAKALFKLNITNYPQTANCYDGLGDLYLAKGDKLKAIESFKKTLSLKIIPETKQKLETLLKENK
jgi:tetratricopeptide (TPR) repeat protein